MALFRTSREGGKENPDKPTANPAEAVGEQPEALNRIINNVVELPVAAISPNPNQPRVIFDDYELSQLAVSIQQNGLLQPITVRKKDDVGFEVISGERRLRASKLIGMEHIPCIVINSSEAQSAVLAILENIQRSDLNYIEEALSIKTLIERFGITQEDCAVKLGVAQSTVANKLRLLRLTDEEKTAVLRYRLNERQARALLRLPPEQRAQAIEKISRDQLNTCQADKMIEEMLKEKPAIKQQTKKQWTFTQPELYIRTFEDTIQQMKKSGIECVAQQNKTEDYVEYLVKIPLK
jgi:ParB family chromosome partitioning protein